MKLGCVGVVLAGGVSQRMGQDKALLRPDGTATLLERTIAQLHEAGLKEVAVVVSTPEHIRSLQAAMPKAGAVPFLVDAEPGHGPLGGLHAALTAYPERDVLLVACDMPHLDTRALRLLCAPDAADIVLPRLAGREQPLHARYGPACLPIAVRLLQQNRLAMRGLTTAPELRARVVDDAELARHGIPATAFTNVNTPADLAGLTSRDTLPNANG
jgi:molybdopterin-guanine dinucleotide biosynthesis protein A